MAKVALSREAYIDVALSLVEEQGIEQLSMRKVATQLGVSPMAIYNHFPNKEELLAASLEALIERARVIPQQDLPWQEWLAYMANAMYRALCEEAGWIPLLGSFPLGSQAANTTAAFIDKLVRSGFNETDAVNAYFAFIQMMIGAVCIRSSGMRTVDEGDNGESLAPLTHAYLKNASPEQLGFAPVLDAASRREPIETGLEFLIAALEGRIEA